MGRDWDLFVVTTLGMVPVLVLLLLRAAPAAAVRRAAAPLFMSGLVLSASWVGVNASADRSIARFEDTLIYDHVLSAYAYETLARTLTDESRHGEALRALEKSCDEQWNPRRMVVIGNMRRELGDVAGAEAAYREVTERSPRDSLAREKWVMLLIERQAWYDVIEVADEGAELFPTNAFYFYYLGQALTSLGRGEEAQAAIQKSQLLRLRQRSP